ncbi:MAG TPA: hypothetical protein VFZ97_10670 [Acidimicrobiales bacterium]
MPLGLTRGGERGKAGRLPERGLELLAPPLGGASQGLTLRDDVGGALTWLARPEHTI